MRGIACLLGFGLSFLTLGPVSATEPPVIFADQGPNWDAVSRATAQNRPGDRCRR
jgi:hypothetical protein